MPPAPAPEAWPARCTRAAHLSEWSRAGAALAAARRALPRALEETSAASISAERRALLAPLRGTDALSPAELGRRSLVARLLVEWVNATLAQADLHEAHPEVGRAEAEASALRELRARLPG